MFDWFTINSAELVLLCTLVGLFLYQIWFYIRYIDAPARQRAAELKEETEPTAAMSADGQLDLFGSSVRGVSVLVCAHNEETNLEDYLHTLLEQDYPMYEVIVINDGSEDDTQGVVERYQRSYRHLRYTFVPKYARVLSTKKLAITLGVKAAHYDYLLLTDADCCVQSKHWISDMMAGYQNEQTELVLGYGAYFYAKDRINTLIQYDTLFNGMHFLGEAIHHHPYMGVGRNMMYTKDLFIRHNGFAGLLNFMAGDDDLFVNKVATGTNTAVVCTPDSITWSLPKRTWREWIIQKRRHLSVSGQYKRGNKIRLGIEPVSRGLWYMGMIIAFAFCSWQLAAAAWLLLVARLIMQMVLLTRASHKMGGPAWGPEILLLDMILPLITLWLMSTTRNKRNLHW